MGGGWGFSDVCGPSRHPRRVGRASLAVLTPTRELAMQIKDHLSQAAKLTPIKACAHLVRIQ